MANSGQVKDGASHALTLQKFDVCCFPFKWSPKHANLQIGPPAPREATNLFCARCTSRVLGDARLSPGPEPEGMNGRIRSEAAVRAGSRQECVNTCVNLSGGGGGAISVKTKIQSHFVFTQTAHLLSITATDCSGGINVVG